MRKLLLIFLILIATQLRAARNWYFDAVSGNDVSGNGTISLPYKTLSKCSSIFSTFSAGDSVLLKRGQTFSGNIIISKSGTTLLPIVISAYGTGERPIFTGMATLSNWVVYSSNIWVCDANASLPAYLRLVVKEDVLQGVGRYPNRSAANQGYLTYESHTALNSITDNQLANIPSWTGAWGAVRVNNSQTEERLITSHVGTVLTFSGDFSGTPANGEGYFFINDLKTLDSSGEWYYNPSTKRVYIYSASAPSNIEAPTGVILINSNNFSNITVDNIFFRGCNDKALNFSSGSGIKVQNCKINFSGINGISTNNTTGITITGDSILNTCDEGIRVDGAPAAVLGVTITNNYVYNSNQFPGMSQDVSGNGRGNGIITKGSDITVRHNIVINSGFCGIKWEGNNNRIDSNFVDSFCFNKNDGGGLYTVRPYTGNTIKNNIVLHGIGALGGSIRAPLKQAQGIYLDNYSGGVIVTNNSVAYCAEYNIFIHGGAGNIITGNTTYSGTYGLTAWEFGAVLLRNTNISNNIFFANIATDITLGLRSDATPSGISLFCSAMNNNAYVRPIGSGNLILRNQSTNISLPMWQTAYPAYDAASTPTPLTITNAAQMAFHYNETDVNKNVVLIGGWVDAHNTPYSGTVVLAPHSSLALIATGNLITPTINWSNPAAITYPAPLTGTQLNATSPTTTGSFIYTPAAGTILSGGTHVLLVQFIPTNTAVYSTATKSVTITVNKASATLSYSNLSRVYNGLPQGVTVTTSPAGLGTVSTLYNGVGATPINAGSYAVTSGLTNVNYTAPNISNTFTITPAPATITVSNLAQVYTGSAKSVNVVTSPVGLSYSVTYDGSATLPINAGSVAIVVTLTDGNYSATPISTSLVIAKATPAVSWATPAAITYGTVLSGTQLSASPSVAGVLAYTPASGTLLNAGTHVLSVNFTPSSSNYNSVNNTTVSLVVNKATATISLSNLNQFFDGNPKSVTVTTSPANLLVITTTYNGSTSPPSAVNTYPVISSLANANYAATPATGNLVISSNAANIFITNTQQVYTASPINVTVTSAFTYTLTYNGSGTAPTNVGSYQAIATINDGIHTGADTQTLVISKAAPIITWSNPSAINFGTALSGTELNATANVAGSFAYSPISGTVLNAGSQSLSTTFTPTDAANYNSVSKTVTIVVNINTATLVLSDLLKTYNGSAQPVTVVTSPAGLSGVVITYNGSVTVPTDAGTYAVVVTLANSLYVATPVTGNLVIAKANAVLTFPTPASVVAGTLLTSIQLAATSNISGTFTYAPTFGQSPPTGTSFIVATFHPTDATNYNSTSISVPISVFGNPSQDFYIRNGVIEYIQIP